MSVSDNSVNHQNGAFAPLCNYTSITLNAKRKRCLALLVSDIKRFSYPFIFCYSLTVWGKLLFWNIEQRWCQVLFGVCCFGLFLHRGLFVRSLGEPGRSRNESGMTVRGSSRRSRNKSGMTGFGGRPGIAQLISGILKATSGGCAWLCGLFTSSRGKPGRSRNESGMTGFGGCGWLRGLFLLGPGASSEGPGTSPG